MTKIRLIRNDGAVLTLDATQYSLNITRSIPVLPVPVLGERAAVDLNMVAADFKIDVMLADDDCASSVFGATAAVASVDFSALANNDGGVHSPYMTGGGTVTVSDLNDNYFEIESTYTGENTTRAPIRIKFNSGTASHSASASPPTVTVGVQGITTDAALAAAVKTACEAANFSPRQVSTTGTTFSSAFTITLSEGVNDPSGTSSRLIFTQVDKGSGGNNGTPTFNKNFTPYIPLYEECGGGVDKSCRSAGDKLQDLIAYVGNASILGATGSLVGGEIPIDGSLSEEQTADYIIGIQIPYNSLLTSTSANDDYIERNLIIVTGRKDANQQDAAANNLGVDVVFDPTDKYTGIAGTVVAMSFNYIAGENVYEGSLTFMPIDLITGT